MVRKIITFITESCFPEAYCHHKCPMGLHDMVFMSFPPWWSNYIQNITWCDSLLPNPWLSSHNKQIIPALLRRRGTNLWIMSFTYLIHLLGRKRPQWCTGASRTPSIIAQCRLMPINNDQNSGIYGGHGSSLFSTETEFDPQNRSSSLQKLSSTHRIEVHLYRNWVRPTESEFMLWWELRSCASTSNSIAGERWSENLWSSTWSLWMLPNLKSVGRTLFLCKKVSLCGFRRHWFKIPLNACPNQCRSLRGIDRHWSAMIVNGRCWDP